MHTVKYSKMRKFSYYSTFRPLNLHSDYDILILLEYRTERTSIITFLVTVHTICDQQHHIGIHIDIPFTGCHNTCGDSIWNTTKLYSD